MNSTTTLQRILHIGRLTHFHPHVDDAYGAYEAAGDDALPVLSPDRGANTVSSLLPNGQHAPCIDLDLPAHLVPSSTPGHFHLYVDAAVDWDRYLVLLDALCSAGLVEPGFVASARRRGFSLLRLPGVRKPSMP